MTKQEHNRIEWCARLLALLFFVLLFTGLHRAFSQEPIQAERWELDTISNSWKQVIPYEPIPDSLVQVDIKMDFGDKDVLMVDGLASFNDFREFYTEVYSPTGNLLGTARVKKAHRVSKVKRYPYVELHFTTVPIKYKADVMVRKWWFFSWTSFTNITEIP